MTEPMSESQIDTAEIAASHETQQLVDEIRRLRAEVEQLQVRDWTRLRARLGGQMTQTYNDLKRENHALHEQLKKQQAEVERLKDQLKRIEVTALEPMVAAEACGDMAEETFELQRRLKAHEEAMGKVRTHIRKPVDLHQKYKKCTCRLCQMDNLLRARLEAK